VSNLTVAFRVIPPLMNSASSWMRQSECPSLT
jgi:hypothetical protein